MDSPQSVVSPFKGLYAFEKQNNHLFVENAGCLSRENGVQRDEVASSNLQDILGILEIFIHEARDIHNICIYHKQDVYAKLCLTSDPEDTVVSTKTINGAGNNPIFNETLQLKVRTIESSLKCEIYMLSNDKNFLEDQMLCFALVPLSEVVLSNGKLEKEFSLSSTDLFHSPAGFVQLSLSYNGALPDVIAIPSPADASMEDAELTRYEFDKIEFPDPTIVNENRQMVSEYFEIPCDEKDMDSSQCCSSNENHISYEMGSENHISYEMGTQFVQSLSKYNVHAIEFQKLNSPPSSVSVSRNESSSTSLSHTQSSESSKSSNEEYASRPGDAESNHAHAHAFIKPLVNIEQDQKMVQQDIVDMYMKSMQQFTDSLAKMKLPLDVDNGPTSSGNSTSDQKSQTSQAANNGGSRVFYGSRAFF